MPCFVSQTQSSHENVCRHILRLLWWIHPKLAASKLSKLMDKLKPSTQVLYVGVPTLHRYVVNTETQTDYSGIWWILKLRPTTQVYGEH